MYGVRETWGTDIAFALAAAAEGYVSTSLAKDGRPGTALILDSVAGVGGLASRHLTGGYTHDILEGVAGAGFGGVGRWAGNVTTTYGNHGPSTSPYWQPTAPASGGAARALAARVAAARARAAAAAGSPGQVPPNPYTEPNPVYGLAGYETSYDA